MSTSSYSHEFWDAVVGKEVVAVDVARAERALRFRCGDGTTVVWEAEADCCSETWWADGFSLNALRGAVVREAGSVELPDYDVNDGRGRQEDDEVYGVRIATDKGEAKLAFRNSSNGYYGGWAALAEDGDRFEWREITGNEWSA